MIEASWRRLSVCRAGTCAGTWRASQGRVREESRRGRQKCLRHPRKCEPHARCDSSRMTVGRLASDFEYNFERDKLFEHRVTFDEAVECSFEDFVIRRNKRYSDRYQLIGATLGGRGSRLSSN